MRALLTCRPLAGHYRPMLPLARALAEAGHDVAFASGEPVAGEAEAEGFTAFRVGLALDSVEPLARRVRDLAASLPPSQVRPFVFTELFVRVELEPRANDLFKVVEQWSPHLVVHDVAEFAAPLVATVAGIPYVEHSYGPAIQSDVIRAAGEATAPFWASHGLAPHPLGGFYRYLYLDVCPPSLQVPGAVTGAVQGIRTVETQPPESTQLPWLDALRDLPIVYITLGTVYNRNLDVFGALLDGLRDEALNIVVTVGKQNDPADARSAAVEHPRAPVHPTRATAPSLRRCRDARWRRLDTWCTRIRPAAPHRPPRRRSVLQRRTRRCRRRRGPAHA